MRSSTASCRPWASEERRFCRSRGSSRIDRTTRRLRRAPELALIRGGGVLIEYGDDKEAPVVVVRSQELFELPSPRQLQRQVVARFESAFTGEDAITSALDRLRQGKGVKVAFTTGHGEPKPDDMGGKGLGNWRARLARVGCEVTEVRLDQGDIPGDLALLIVVIAISTTFNAGSGSPAGAGDR